jgi:hypothetical protein
MVNKKTWLGILVLLLIFGMIVVGCDDGNGDSSNGGTDPVLNETWLHRPYGDTVAAKWIMSNGISETYGFAAFANDLIPNYKGTYSTSNGKITSNNTHIHGILASTFSTPPFVNEQIEFDQSKWYSLNEFKNAIFSAGITEEKFYQYFGSVYEKNVVSTYSVNGNTLIINGLTWTKNN